MPAEPASQDNGSRPGRIPPHSHEAEQGVIGCILLDAERALDFCIERKLSAESFHIPAHRSIYDVLVSMSSAGEPVDVLTVTQKLRDTGQLERVGGAVELDRIIDATPTAAHAEYYISLVREKHILRSVIDWARAAERQCIGATDSADTVLSDIEQRLLGITDTEHGRMVPWAESVKLAMEHIEKVFLTKTGIYGLSTGFRNLDKVLMGMKRAEMIIIAARPSMGKTSLAMNIAENVALGKLSQDGSHAVGIFSLEMSREALLVRMLCSHARVSTHKISEGYVSANEAHGPLTQAASALSKVSIHLDDTGGLDVLELRARARRMKQKYNIELVVVDYLQLLHSKEHSRQGLQVETAAISGHLKTMAKELDLPVLALSQLSRAPDTRDKSGTPRLSDLRDSGAIEQDADVVCMLRRPCRYPEDELAGDVTLAIVDIVKQRNGPTGEVHLNFEEEFTRFADRAGGGDNDLGAMEMEEPVELP
jgi:replicative DNA helicase